MAGDPFTREYSQRLGTLTGAQLQAALDRFGLGRLQAAEPAPEGLFGQNVFLKATTGEWVLRGAPHFEGQLQKERFFARFIHERTDVPAPWPYEIAAEPDPFGWSYAVMPWLPSIRVPAEDADAQRQFAVAMGDALARLHEPCFEGYGDYQPELDGIRFESGPHTARIGWRLGHWLERARRASDATTPADAEWCTELLERYQDALEEPFAGRYVHHDFKWNNVAVLPDERRGGLRLSGIFDLMEGYVGDPDEDLVRQLGHYVRTGLHHCIGPFVEAYARRQPFRPGARDRYRVYMMFDLLVVWEYGQRNRCWFPPGVRFRQFAEPIVEYPVPGMA